MTPTRPLTSLLLLLLVFGCSDNPGKEPATAAVPTARSGEQVVNAYCVQCHGRGLYNAPKIGDAAAWQAKLAEGQEHLWQVVLNGEKAMPPRGNCHDCSDAELRAAMDHLLAASLPVAEQAVIDGSR